MASDLTRPSTNTFTKESTMLETITPATTIEELLELRLDLASLAEPTAEDEQTFEVLDQALDLIEDAYPPTPLPDANPVGIDSTIDDLRGLAELSVGEAKAKLRDALQQLADILDHPLPSIHDL